jgi:sensor histidine kinase YesM
MSLRYTDKVAIRMELPSGVPEKTIPPLILIPFVENAFKHGISYRQASFIDIGISIEGGKLVFVCRNSKAPREEGKQGGVGLQNIKQRLELIYGKNYTLDIDEQSETYNITLILPL